MTTITISSPSPRMTLEDLTPELICQILKHIDPRTLYNLYGDGPRLDYNSIRAIAACRLASKYLDSIARPFLFQFISINYFTHLDRISQFRRMLEHDPTIAQGTHTFWLYGEPPDDPSEHHIQHVTTELWHNLDLPFIFDRFISLKTFAFEVIAYPYMSGLALDWSMLGKEMKEGMIALMSRSTLRCLQITDVIGLPVDLITRCHHLEYLDVKNINQEFDDSVPASNPVQQPPTQSRNEWTIKSVKANWNCEILFDFNPIVERLDWDWCGDAHKFNALLLRSHLSLKDLTIHFPRADLYMTTPNPPLHNLKSLTTFRVHADLLDLSPSLMATITSFLTTQFQNPSPSITYFQLRVIGNWVRTTKAHRDSTRFSHSQKPDPTEKTDPTDWQSMETALRVLFPGVRKVVFEMMEPVEREAVERLMAFVKWALPAFVDMPSVQVLLRFRLEETRNERQEMEVGLDGISHVTQV